MNTPSRTPKRLSSSSLAAALLAASLTSGCETIEDRANDQHAQVAELLKAWGEKDPAKATACLDKSRIAKTSCIVEEAQSHRNIDPDCSKNIEACCTLVQGQALQACLGTVPFSLEVKIDGK